MNLEVPLLLLLIATAVFGYVFYHLCVSIFRDENTKLTYVCKGVLALALIYVLTNSAIKTFGILVLNVAVAATGLFFFLFIGYLFNSEEREA